MIAFYAPCLAMVSRAHTKGVGMEWEFHQEVLFLQGNRVENFPRGLK